MPQITISFGEKEFPEIKALLNALYPEKTPLRAKMKKAIKAATKAAKVMKKDKARSPKKTEIEHILDKKYLTSKGNFVPVRNLAVPHIFNIIRKMEREAKYIKNPETEQYYRDADEAFPARPGFAGYADLIRVLRWHAENHPLEEE